MVTLSHRTMFDEKPKQVLIDFENGTVLLNGKKILGISGGKKVKISVTEKYLYLEDKGNG